MIEKKSRLILLVVSIAISTMLLVASIGVVEIILNSYSSAYTKGNEGKGIVISSDNKEFFDLDDVNLKGVEDYEGEICYAGLLSHENDDSELIYVTMRGKEKEQIADKYEQYVLRGRLGKLNDNTCIISQRISENYKLKLNDKITITVNGEDVDFKIVCICANTGVFYRDLNTQFSVIIPYDYLERYLDAEGGYNTLFAKPEKDTISESIKTFEKANKDDEFTAEQLYNDEAISKNYSSFFISMYAMLTIVVIVCFVIISGAFSLILNERMSTIGTFMSLGATKGKIKQILYLESVIYGLIGGVLGDLFGVGVLMIINYIVSPLAKYGIIEKFSINVLYLLVGILFAIILSFVSAFIPINKINKLPIKEVILNNYYVPVKVGWLKFCVGLIMIIAAAVGAFVDETFTINLSVVFSVCVVVGIILVSTKLIDILTGFLCSLVKNKLCIIYLALNNLRSSQVLLSSVTLIIVALISSISISAVSYSIITELGKAFSELDYDIAISNISESKGDRSTTESIVEKLKELSFVGGTSINPFYTKTALLDDKSMVYVIGVEPEKFRNYMEYLELDAKDNKNMYNKFTKSSRKYIILANRVMEVSGKKVGDTVKLEIDDVEQEFTIIGQVKGKMYDSGAFTIINFNSLSSDFPESDKITLNVNTTAEEAKIKLNKEIFDYGAISITKAEEETSSIEQMETLCQSLTIFSRLIIVIAIFGIINNLLVGLFQRKKELALLSSIGMNSSDVKIMLLMESVITFFWATILIVPYSYFMIILVDKFMQWTGLAVQVKINSNDMLLIVAITFISVISTSIPVLLKSRKISIINELRYE